MRTVAILMLLLWGWGWGCGKPPDRLTPYVEKVKPLEKYHKKLIQYRKYLKTEGMARQAHDISKVFEDYRSDLEAIGPTEDKYIRAAHNNVKRALTRALTKLVQPDFPTFIPSANKQIDLIERKVKVDYLDALRKRWERAGKTEPFPLAWPEED